MNVLFDMETSDPDDAITLCWLLSRDDINLRAVTVTPGTKAQIGIIKRILKEFDKNIPIGSEKPLHEKKCVSGFHYSWLGPAEEAEADGIGGDIIASIVGRYPDLTILTGGPLGNVRRAIERGIKVDKIFMQGGFAGDNVVAEEDRLDKFKGKITCPTFNFNGNVEAAKLTLSYDGFGQRYLISKNVCHSVIYDKDLHGRFKGHNMIKGLMDTYLIKHPAGKMLHDPLAACCMVDKSIATFKEVMVYREKGEWGCSGKEGTNTYITVKIDKDKFYDLFSA